MRRQKASTGEGSPVPTDAEQTEAYLPHAGGVEQPFFILPAGEVLSQQGFGHGGLEEAGGGEGVVVEGDVVCRAAGFAQRVGEQRLECFQQLLAGSGQVGCCSCCTEQGMKLGNRFLPKGLQGRGGIVCALVAEGVDDLG